MTMPIEIRILLLEHLLEQSSSFSIGCFGAIAEFHKLDSDQLEVCKQPSALESITTTGALRIETKQDVMPIAYECVSKNVKHWQQGIVFCLPQKQAQMAQRRHITELGPDCEALQAKHQSAILFDLGLAAENIDFCIRTEDAGLIDTLREYCGQSFFSTPDKLKAQILQCNPHRVILSRIGRIEVYQPIDQQKTPEGSHTHLLPKLLASGRTHSANIPVPEGYLPVLSLYPKHALSRTDEGDMQLDNTLFDEFQAVLQKWGRKAYVSEKQRVLQAVLSGEKPDNYVMPSERYIRAASRITLRQMHYQYPNLENLHVWNSFI